jgi:hypothetical protein
MELEVSAFIENLNSGREELVSVQELESFSLTPGACSSDGHGCSSSSSGEDLPNNPSGS